MVRRTLILRVGLALAALTAATQGPQAVAQQRELDLDGLVGWPFPSGLVAAESAPVVAWVRNERGARNVWVARAPEWSGRRVTDFSGDDGQEIAGLAVSANGRVVAFVRGGAPNRAREIPNPTSDPRGTRREVWTTGADGSGAAPLGPGHSPLPTADGGLLYYIQDNVIMRRPVADPDAEPEELVAGRGSPAELTLSPDETRLAWTSRRGDHAFVGVLELRDRSLRWLAPSVDRDGSPTWSPDGREVAFVRIPNRKDQLPFFAVREGAPWSVRAVSVEDGTARTVFTAPPGPGSVFNGVSASRQIFWGRGGRIAFPWEGNGFRNLYSVAADGGDGANPRPIATGAFEVQYVARLPGGDALVFSSNQDDIDRQHLWRGAMDGSDTRQITAGDGVEWQPAPAADGSLAFLASSGTAPAHAEVLAANDGGAERAADAHDDRRWLVATQRADLPAGLVDPRQLVFTAPDGTPIHGQLFLPGGAPPDKGWPAVLFLHGGSRRQMLLGFHHRGYYHNAYSFNQYLASKGYAVLSVNYRSGTGYGMEFREAENYGAGGASEVQDVLGAGVYMAERDDVDPERIGLWGGSYGGYLTAHGLAQASRLFRAGVDVHGVHDWNPVIRNFVPSYDPAARPEVARSAFDSSPMAHVDGWRSPVLLIHGDDDRNVPFSESVELAEALRSRGVHVEQLVFPDEVHGFLLHRNWMAAFEAAAEFFDRFLANAGGGADGSGPGPNGSFDH